MESITFSFDDSTDNDSVMSAAQRLYESKGENGWDDLLDCLNGAYSADMRVSRAADKLGRASLHEALELLEGDYTEEEHAQAMALLLQGMVLRAVKLNMVR